jgi:hypothetical protein
MPLDPMIARPYVPDVSNTLGEIARLKVADQYRQAQVAQDQQQFDYRKQRDAQADAEDDENDLAFDALSAQAKQAFDQGGYQAAFPILLQASRYHSDAAAMLDTHYRAEEERKKPKLPDYKVVGDTMLEMPTAPGQDPREVYRAPQKPQQAPVGSWSSPFQGVGPDGKPGLYRQHSVSGKVEPLNLGAVPKGGTQQSAKATKEAGLAQSRINAARTATTELDEAMKALQQSRLFGTGPIAGRLGGMAAPVQRYEAAVRRLFGHIQAITRIPGIGSQSDWEGRMQLLTLPSAEYDESINLQAAGELKQFLQDVEMAYQNAYGESGVAPRGAAGSWDEKSSNDGWSVEEQP